MSSFVGAFFAKTAGFWTNCLKKNCQRLVISRIDSIEDQRETIC